MVAFATTESLVAADTDARADVYLRSGDETTLETGSADTDTGTSEVAGLSADGERLVVRSTSPLTAEDTDLAGTDFYERHAGTSTLLTAGGPPTGHAFQKFLSADASVLVFNSNSPFSPLDDDCARADLYAASVDGVLPVSLESGPTPLLTSAPCGKIETDSTTIEFEAPEGAPVECRLDADPFEACDSPAHLSGLAEGPHVLELRLPDVPGAVTKRREFSVDTGDPETELDDVSPPSRDGHGRTFRFHSADADARFQCRTDAISAWWNCRSSYSARFENGFHTFRVRAVDSFGRVDQTPPEAEFDVAAPPDPPGEPYPLGNMTQYEGVTGEVVAGDLTDDGLDDLVVSGAADGTPGLFVMPAAGEGTFEEPSRIGDRLESLRLADLNGDGALDVLGGSGAGEDHALSVRLGDGTGAFGAEDHHEAPYCSRIAPGDFDGDGQTDVAQECSLGGVVTSIVVSYGSGDGTFAETSTSAIYLLNHAEVTISSVSGIAPGELNGDGRTDLVVALNNNLRGGPLTSYLGSADRELIRTEKGFEYSGNPRSTTLADLDEDGLDDMLLRGSGFQALQAERHMGIGDGGFRRADSRSRATTPALPHRRWPTSTVTGTWT